RQKEKPEARLGLWESSDRLRFARHRRHRVAQARHDRRLRHAAIAQRPKHFQHLAPGRERPAIVALVLVHRLHEIDLFAAVVALAGRRVDLTAPLSLRPAVFAATAFEGDGDVSLAAIVGAPVRDAVLGSGFGGTHWGGTSQGRLRGWTYLRR